MLNNALFKSCKWIVRTDSSITLIVCSSIWIDLIATTVFLADGGPASYKSNWGAGQSPWSSSSLIDPNVIPQKKKKKKKTVKLSNINMDDAIARDGRWEFSPVWNNWNNEACSCPCSSISECRNNKFFHASTTSLSYKITSTIRIMENSDPVLKFVTRTTRRERRGTEFPLGICR